ncbi:hypothetical protein GN956_G19331 [Arapaima gigas]
MGALVRKDRSVGGDVCVRVGPLRSFKHTLIELEASRAPQAASVPSGHAVTFWNLKQKGDDAEEVTAFSSAESDISESPPPEHFSGKKDKPLCHSRKRTSISATGLRLSDHSQLFIFQKAGLPYLESFSSPFY